MRKFYLLAFLFVFYTASSGQTLLTDYFRSRIPGPADWNTPSTWESSHDNNTWITATDYPTSAANTISIRIGHVVTMTTSVSADQLVIEVGGGLLNEMTAGNVFTITDGAGEDMDIQFGAYYRVNTTEPYTSHISITPGALIHIEAGGTIEIGSSATGTTDYASTSAVFDWDDGSIFTWATISVPDIERTFFPNALTTEVPIFRFTSPVSSMGGSADTRINGRLESTVNLGFAGTGFKYFRNGIKLITPSITIDGSGSGKFIINGVTAQLGGLSGNLITPSAGIDVGNGLATTVTMTAPLFTVTGNINLIGANSIIELLNYGLTVTGNVNLTVKTSYVKTNGTGLLTLLGVGLNFPNGKLFPVGLSSINPLYISSDPTADYSARIVEPITPPIYNNNAAVLRTWYISSTANAPATCNISFGYSDPGDLGPSFINSGPVVQVGVHIATWNIVQSGLTPLTFPLVFGTYYVKPTVSISYFNGTTTEFPFVVANNGAILSNDCIINARSQKISGKALISWDINSCTDVTSFSVERSVNNSRFETVGTVFPGTALHYEWVDAMPAVSINAYRIRVNRTPGEIKYSNTVAVINDSKGLLITSVFPNPVEDRAVIRLTAGRKGVVNFRLVNSTGSIVRQWLEQVTEGSNTIIFSPGSLARGVYYLQASGLGGYHQYRLVK
jgi:hypothetical protein